MRPIEGQVGVTLRDTSWIPGLDRQGFPLSNTGDFPDRGRLGFPLSNTGDFPDRGRLGLKPQANTAKPAKAGLRLCHLQPASAGLDLLAWGFNPRRRGLGKATASGTLLTFRWCLGVKAQRSARHNSSILLDRSRLGLPIKGTSRKPQANTAKPAKAGLRLCHLQPASAGLGLLAWDFSPRRHTPGETPALGGSLPHA